MSHVTTEAEALQSDTASVLTVPVKIRTMFDTVSLSSPENVEMC